jgi:uncharacterized membrane protein
MAEEEQGHRHRMDVRTSRAGTRGQYMGFSLGVLAIVSSFILLYTDKDVGGLVTLVIGLGPVITSFFLRRKGKGNPADDAE